MKQKVEVIRDTGVEISVFQKELVPGKCLTGGHIYLVPAVGEMQKADLITYLPTLERKNNEDFINAIF